jgi:hypothetical protein
MPSLGTQTRSPRFVHYRRRPHTGQRDPPSAGRASEERPRWSPDGTQLIYYSDAGGSWEVYTVLVETGATRSLTAGPGVRRAAGMTADSALRRLAN